MDFHKMRHLAFKIPKAHSITRLALDSRELKYSKFVSKFFLAYGLSKWSSKVYASSPTNT